MACELLICPDCRSASPLQALPGETGGLLRCGACGQAFPTLGAIPVLFSDAKARVTGWAERLGAFQAETDEAVRQLLAQSVQEGLIPRTRARLTAVAEGLRDHALRIGELFSDAGLVAAGQRGSTRGLESILSYYALIHRDWGWAPEVDEVNPAVDALLAVLPAGFQLGNTLVLGAGTGRLAWELGNRAVGAGTIVAVDINPLPLLVTKRLMDGSPVSLFELPGHPRRSTFACTERALKAETPPPPGLHLILADGLNPPVRDGAFDTVVTPWFVDQVPEDLASLPAMIRRVLRPGGAWLNQGPFVYDPARTKPAHRYCADEFVQIVNGSGFAVSKATYVLQSHMASPVSGQARAEWVLSMHATATFAERVVPVEPSWLAVSTNEPIPPLDGLQDYTAPHPAIAAVARLIDGRKSATAIATDLVASNELSPDGAVEAVLACVRVIWSELQCAQSKR